MLPVDSVRLNGDLGNRSSFPNLSHVKKLLAHSASLRNLPIAKAFEIHLDQAHTLEDGQQFQEIGLYFTTSMLNQLSPFPLDD